MIGSFCSHHSICLNIGFWHGTLYGNDAFSILVLSTKKRYSSFLKKIFVFEKICFKVKYWKRLKIFTDCYIRTCRSLKRGAILKIPSTVFWKNLCSFCWPENESSKKKRLPVLRQKPNVAVKLVWRSNHSFLLSIWWITFFKYLYL